MKNVYFGKKITFSKIIRQNLSKTDPIMSKLHLLHTTALPDIWTPCSFLIQNAIFWPNLPKMLDIPMVIKIDPEVVNIFRDRFWKAETPYFPFLFFFFFANLGIFATRTVYIKFGCPNATFLVLYRFGYKKASKSRNLSMQF